jgi:hypothetical protein
MEFAQNVGRGFFPLDEELKLMAGELTPYGHESLVRLSGWMPFEKAVELFEDFMGIRVNKNVSQKYTEEAGAAYVQMQDEEVKRLQKKMPRAKARPEKLQISADGAMVPLLHGVWAEVRTLVVGEVQPAVQEKGEAVVHTRNLSYFSRKASSQEFELSCLAEMHRRGVENAQEVAAVMDGAEWEQGFTDYHCPQAVRILDFAHAVGHISQIGEFLHGEHTPEHKAWLGKRLHRLKHEGPHKLLLEFQRLQRKYPESKPIAGNLAYLKKREQQIQYPIFQAQGWPIGSGIVESGNKLVVEARLKGAGMHWADQNVNPMLAIRNILCSDRWKKEWPKIEAQLRKQRSVKRSQLRQARILAAKSSKTPLLLPVETNPPDTWVPTPKKAKTNPWRNFKHGKALYQHSSPPKI